MKFFAVVTPLKKIRLEMSLNEIVECCSYYYLEVGDVKQNEVIRATNCVYRDIVGYPIEIVIDEDSGELMCRITLYIGEGTHTVKIGEAYKPIKKLIKIRKGSRDIYESAQRKAVKTWLLQS